MSPVVVVRAAEAADARAIGAVFDAAVLAGWGFMDDVEDLVPMFAPEHWDDLVAGTRAPDRLHVAEVAGRVVGFVATKDEGGELYLLFVDPAAGGSGVGRTLLRTAHATLRAQGHRTAFLFTHVANERAVAVYEAAGYRPDGSFREEPFRGRTLREQRMVVELA